MTLLTNKKATFDFEILKEFEAGLELLGTEVKSLRNKKGNLTGSRVLVRGNEAFLVGATISPWQEANAPKDYDPERSRRLLLKKKELAELSGSETQKGLTLVPLSLYNSGRKLKLKFGLARGKKKHDKRQIIKERESKRKIGRSLKNN